MKLSFGRFSAFWKAVRVVTKEELKAILKLLKSYGKRVESFDDLVVNMDGIFFDHLPDGTFIKVNLYESEIEVDDSFDSQNISPKILKPYHIYQCSRVVKKLRDNPSQIFTINNRDNGLFHVSFRQNNKEVFHNKNQELPICKECLAHFNSLHRTTYSVANFRLKKHYQNRDTIFNFNTTNLERGEQLNFNTNTILWDKISKKIKLKKEYTCEYCDFTPQNEYDKKFIHAHHRRWNRVDYADNLKILCIKCHTKERHHLDMQDSADYREFEEKFGEKVVEEEIDENGVEESNL
jgi:hypothetical protein